MGFGVVEAFSISSTIWLVSGLVFECVLLTSDSMQIYYCAQRRNPQLTISHRLAMWSLPSRCLCCHNRIHLYYPVHVWAMNIILLQHHPLLYYYNIIHYYIILLQHHPFLNSYTSTSCLLFVYLQYKSHNHIICRHSIRYRVDVASRAFCLLH